MNPQTLVKLGLTPDEARLYLFLINRQMFNPKQVASGMRKQISAVSRLAKTLSEKGFVVISKGRPAIYQPVIPEIAVESYINTKQRELEILKIKSKFEIKALKPPERSTYIQMLSNKDETLTKFLELARAARSEILIISIGEPVPDTIKLTHLKAVKKGVVIKLIVHKYDKNNKDLLKSWVKMGTEVRYFRDSGYHLMIFDGERSILVASNPDLSEERTGMTIHSTDLTAALRMFFYSLWDKAEPILL